MKFIYTFLLTILAIILICLFQLPDNNLHIIACDVGQGDAILFTYKRIQVLTDGGPDTKVMNCLGRHVPFWDRTIELVISTHPDADHSTGLTYVLKRYKVQKILINPIDSGTQIIKVLENQVRTRAIPIVSPLSSTEIRVGMMSLDIVNPTEERIVNLTQKVEGSPLNFFKPIDPTNEYSISYVLAFGKFRGLFTGDVGPTTSDHLARELVLSKIERVHYIKVPHHGSKNGLTQNLLEKIMPKYAVISVGKNNRYGHPTPEVLQMLQKFNVKILRTDEVGDVEFVTDGESYWIKKLAILL